MPTKTARWGACSEPSGGVADPVTGKLANGSGNSVSANVLFDPWLETAVENNTGGSSGSLPVGPLTASISAFLVWWKRRKQRQG